MATPSAPEIESSFVVSTAHITPRDSKLLQDDAYPYVCDLYGYGHLAYVGDTRDFANNRPALAAHGMSPEFLHLMKLCTKWDCAWLRLDCDGPTYPELPTFDW